MSLTQPLHDHHKHCDDLFADAEAAARDGDWTKCAEAYKSFHNQLEAHFSTEEQVLFPAFEEATGMAGGPTRVMRIEHTQMRDLLAQMASALAGKNEEGFLGSAETLLVLMQQHNMKEESMLYPMCDRSLDGINVEGELKRRLGAT